MITTNYTILHFCI